MFAQLLVVIALLVALLATVSEAYFGWGYPYFGYGFGYPFYGGYLGLWGR